LAFPVPEKKNMEISFMLQYGWAFGMVSTTFYAIGVHGKITKIEGIFRHFPG